MDNKLNLFNAYKLILFKYCNNKWLLVILIFAIITSVAATCINPLIFRKIIDVGLPTKDIHSLIILLTLAFLLFLISVLSSFIQYHVAAKVGANIINHLRLKMFQSMLNLNLNQKENEFTESILTRLTKDIGFLEYNIIFTIWAIIQYSLSGIISVCLLFYINWSMALLITGLMPLVILSPRWLLNKASHHALARMAFETKIFSMAKEAISMQDVIRLLSIKKYKRKSFKQLLKAEGILNYLYNANIGLGSRSAVLGFQFINLVILSAGVVLVMTNFLTLGSLIGFLILLGNIGSAANTLSTHYPNLILGSDSINRIIELIRAIPARKGKIGKNKLLTLKQSIVFSNVYAESSGKEILSNVNLTILAGEYVAIVGPSGAGKTTILKLLLREHPIMSGKILLDNKDLHSFSLNSIYKKIGVVTQQSKLFSTTITENIRLGKLTAEDDDIISAAKLAEIHDDIMSLPNGYNTKVGETTLSGGQVQRIAVARALIAKPSILCLDEATASIDPQAAASLDSAFKSMAGNITILFVTHRLRSAIKADRIFMLQRGQIIETGTHEELIKKGGLYNQYWHKQNDILTEDIYAMQIDIYKLKKIPLFSELDDATLNAIKDEFVVEDVPEGQIVIEEGGVGNKFYIILSGQVDISKLDTETNKMIKIANMDDGDYFGEIALLYDIPRIARITTKCTSIFLTLDRQSFHKFFIRLSKDVQSKIISVAQERLENLHI